MVLFAVLLLFDWHSLERFGAQGFERIVGCMVETSCADLVLNTCSSCGGIGRYYCIGLDGKVGLRIGLKVCIGGYGRYLFNA